MAGWLLGLASDALWHAFISPGRVRERDRREQHLRSQHSSQVEVMWLQAALERQRTLTDWWTQYTDEHFIKRSEKNPVRPLPLPWPSEAERIQFPWWPKPPHHTHLLSHPSAVRIRDNHTTAIETVIHGQAMRKVLSYSFTDSEDIPHTIYRADIWVAQLRLISWVDHAWHCAAAVKVGEPPGTCEDVDRKAEWIRQARVENDFLNRFHRRYDLYCRVLLLDSANASLLQQQRQGAGISRENPRRPPLCQPVRGRRKVVALPGTHLFRSAASFPHSGRGPSPATEQVLGVARNRTHH